MGGTFPNVSSSSGGMRTLLKAAPVLLCGASLFAEYPGLTLPPSGNNQKAAVTQFIGPVKVTIEYSSPAVHGPDGKDRRGQIWGKLVPYGMSNLGFGNGSRIHGARGRIRIQFSRYRTVSS